MLETSGAFQVLLVILATYPSDEEDVCSGRDLLSKAMPKAARFCDQFLCEQSPPNILHPGLDYVPELGYTPVSFDGLFIFLLFLRRSVRVPIVWPKLYRMFPPVLIVYTFFGAFRAEPLYVTVICHMVNVGLRFFANYFVRNLVWSQRRQNHLIPSHPLHPLQRPSSSLGGILNSCQVVCNPLGTACPS